VERVTVPGGSALSALQQAILTWLCQAAPTATATFCRLTSFGETGSTWAAYAFPDHEERLGFATCRVALTEAGRAVAERLTRDGFGGGQARSEPRSRRHRTKLPPSHGSDSFMVPLHMIGTPFAHEWQELRHTLCHGRPSQTVSQVGAGVCLTTIIRTSETHRAPGAAGASLAGASSSPFAALPSSPQFRWAGYCKQPPARWPY
jgi:hypothetical protein